MRPTTRKRLLTCIDKTQAAWAAGFFDAEGSTVFGRNGARRRLRVQVPQSDRGCGVEALERFRSAVGGVGLIGGPDAKGVFTYYASNLGDSITVFERIVPWLSGPKRKQFVLHGTAAMAAMTTGARPVGRRSVRRRANLDHLRRVLRRAAAPPEAMTAEESDAWATGLLEGDGSIDVSGGVTDGTEYLTLRVAVGQSDAFGVPEVLTRFQGVAGGGRIYRMDLRGRNCMPEYKWTLARPNEVEHLLARLRPYLGQRKSLQAERALAAHAEFTARRAILRASR